MVVENLQKFITLAGNSVSSEHNLCNLKGRTLLVDSNSFTRYILFLVAKCCPCDGLDKLRGGEYDRMDMLIKFVCEQLLETCKLSLSFYENGPVGSDCEFCDLKERFLFDEQTVKNSDLESLVKICNKQLPFQAASKLESYCIGYLADLQIRESLKGLASVNLIPCVGDSAIAIGKAFHKDSKIFAVWSDDTEFLIQDGCRCLLHSTFDPQGEMIQAYKAQRSVRNLMVRVFSTQSLQTELKLPSAEALADAAALCGNKFTSNLVKNNVELADFYGDITSAADFVRENLPILQSPKIMRLAPDGSALAQAIEYSRRYYTHSISESSQLAHLSSDVSRFIVDQCKRGTFLNDCLSYINRVNFCGQKGHLFCDAADYAAREQCLRAVRRLIYTLAMPSDTTTIKEYHLDGTIVSVKPAHLGAFRRADEIYDLEETYRLSYADVFLSGLEIDLNSVEGVGDGKNYFHNYFQMYGNKQALLCYLVNMVLTLHALYPDTLNLTRTELLAFTATVFAHVFGVRMADTVILPSKRCMDLADVFQLVTRYCANIVTILRLEKYWPQPKDLFISRRFAAACMQFGRKRYSAAGLDKRVVERFDTILEENKALSQERKEELYPPPEDPY